VVTALSKVNHQVQTFVWRAKMNKNIYDLLSIYDEAGYDREGYDIWGYDREGFDREGFDKFGYDREGFNRKGFDREGFSLFQKIN